MRQTEPENWKTMRTRKIRNRTDVLQTLSEGGFQRKDVAHIKQGSGRAFRRTKKRPHCDVLGHGRKRSEKKVKGPAKEKFLHFLPTFPGSDRISGRLCTVYPQEGIIGLL